MSSSTLAHPDPVSVTIDLSMKQFVLILTFLAIMIDFGLCQYDYAYDDAYAYDDYPVAPPPRRRGGYRGYRLIYGSPFARPRPLGGGVGYLSRFTTHAPNWTPYPGT